MFRPFQRAATALRTRWRPRVEALARRQPAAHVEAGGQFGLFEGRIDANADGIAVDIENGYGHFADLHRLADGEFHFGFVHPSPP